MSKEELLEYLKEELSIEVDLKVDSIEISLHIGMDKLCAVEVDGWMVKALS